MLPFAVARLLRAAPTSTPWLFRNRRGARRTRRRRGARGTAPDQVPVFAPRHQRSTIWYSSALARARGKAPPAHAVPQERRARMPGPEQEQATGAEPADGWG